MVQDQEETQVMEVEVEVTTVTTLTKQQQTILTRRQQSVLTRQPQLKSMGHQNMEGLSMGVGLSMGHKSRGIKSKLHNTKTSEKTL